KKLGSSTSPVRTLAFNPDGGLLAAGSADGTVRIQNLRNLKEVPIAIGDNYGWICSLGFNPQGTLLAVGSADHNVHFIETRPEQMVAQLRAQLKRNLSQNEWDLYVGE